MEKSKSDHGLTRRSFLELGSMALATAGVLGSADAAGAMPGEASQGATHSAAMTGKIALEEHFAIPETVGSSTAAAHSSDFREKILEMGSGRIAEMDRGGVELCILSLVNPGIQGIPAVPQAVSMARRANDYLAGQIAKYPKRWKGFAALPLQDPEAAAAELTRCVKELGFCGALAHGFSQVGVADSAVYYDLPQYRPFWATVQQLDVPFYLHPRPPLPSRSQAYEGHRWMLGSPWGFAAETSIHALRLMGSGLFDEFPRLKIILGHLGEGVPFSIWRVDHRITKGKLVLQAKRPLRQYLRENFYITTSGYFHTPALMDVLQEVGPERTLYSVDYPFEDMTEAAQWFDHTPISDTDRRMIARDNAQKLFRL